MTQTFKELDGLNSLRVALGLPPRTQAKQDAVEELKIEGERAFAELEATIDRIPHLGEMLETHFEAFGGEPCPIVDLRAACPRIPGRNFFVALGAWCALDPTLHITGDWITFNASTDILAQAFDFALTAWRVLHEPTRVTDDWIMSDHPIRLPVEIEEATGFIHCQPFSREP